MRRWIPGLLLLPAGCGGTIGYRPNPDRFASVQEAMKAVRSALDGRESYPKVEVTDRKLEFFNKETGTLYSFLFAAIDGIKVGQAGATPGQLIKLDTEGEYYVRVFNPSFPEGVEFTFKAKEAAVVFADAVDYLRRTSQ